MVSRILLASMNDARLTFTDSFVSKRPDPKVVVTSAAYLLFYRRRSSVPLGGPFFEGLKNVADQENPESQPTSRAQSPAGEGKRLDDSSRTGSSSALRAVGAAHQAGGGGSVVGNGLQRLRTGVDDDEPVDNLPAYSAQDPQGTLDPRDLQEQTLEGMEVDEDEGIGGMEGISHPPWQGPLQYQGYSEPSWSFGSNGHNAANNSPRGSGEELEGPDEDLFADESSTKVARSSTSDLLENRMADFNDEDEGTTGGGFLRTPPPENVPVLDVPPMMEEVEQPVAEVMLEDEGRAGYEGFGRGHGGQS